MREYSINLSIEISTMSWRRFLVLLGGLSSNSLWFTINRSLSAGPTIIEDPVEAERYVNNIWN